MIKESGIVELDQLTAVCEKAARSKFAVTIDPVAVLPVARQAATLIAELQAERDEAREGFKMLAQEFDIRNAELAAAEFSLDRVRAETAWQPIETAPKDGRKVIYHNGALINPVVGICCWMDWSFEYQEEESEDACWWDHERDDEACPKFWMNETQPPAVADTNADAPRNVGLVSGVSTDPSSLNITGLDTGAVKTVQPSIAEGEFTDER